MLKSKVNTNNINKIQVQTREALSIIKEFLKRLVLQFGMLKYLLFLRRL